MPCTPMVVFTAVSCVQKKASDIKCLNFPPSNGRGSGILSESTTTIPQERKGSNVHDFLILILNPFACVCPSPPAPLIPHPPHLSKTRTQTLFQWVGKYLNCDRRERGSGSTHGGSLGFQPCRLLKAGSIS
jgi:hypothetical protein